MTERTSSFMLETITKDAEAWWKRGHGRSYVRNPDTEKSLPIKIRRELDAVFDEQRRDADDRLIAWYENRVTTYGGDIEQLPWRKKAKRDGRAD